MENKSRVRLARGFTQVNMPEPARLDALQAAMWVTASPCEWTWTDRQQELMARYCLWAAQRIACMQSIANELPLLYQEAI